MIDIRNIISTIKMTGNIFGIMFLINVITVIIIFVRKESKLMAVCSAVLYFYASYSLVLYFVVYQLMNLYGYTADLLTRVSYSVLNEQFFVRLRIPSYECRVRFICETSRLVTTNNEALISFLRFAHLSFGAFDGDYVSGALQGLSGVNCSDLYATCNYSPLEKTFPFMVAE